MDPHNGGNIQNEIIKEEHDHTSYAKRVSLVASSATIYAVVNTSAAGQASVVLDTGTRFIGLTTVVQASSARSITGNVTLSNSNTYIGLTTTTLGAGLSNIGFATVAVSTPTLFAVVNTGAGAAGQATVTLLNSPSFIGIVTVANPGTTSGNVTLNPSENFIGLVTAVTDQTQYLTGTANATPVGNVMLGKISGNDELHPINIDANHNTVIVPSDPIPVTQSGSWSQTLGSGVAFIGFATVIQASSARTITGNLTLSNSQNFIGLVTAVPSSTTRSIVGNITLSNTNTYIGLTTATLGLGTRFIGLVTVVQSSSARTITGNVTLSNPNTYIGLTTTTLGIGTQFIGLVTATTRNAGTTKTLIPLPIAFGGTSVATIFVPTNTFKLTSLMLSANATTGISVKSGVTYLTGNASIRVTLLPGGGFADSGTVDSPVYIGLAGAAALVIEKNDATTLVSGKVMYFDE